MAILGQCRQCRNFRGGACSLFTPVYDSCECESFDQAPYPFINSAAAGTEDAPGTPQVIFDDSYKHTPSRERMSGWLKFFLIFFVGIFGLVSLYFAVTELLSHPREEGAWWDMGMAAVAAAVAAYTIVGFARRSPDAVFLAKLYVAIHLCISVFLWLGADSSASGAYMAGLTIGTALWCAWLLYLLRSRHVRRLIPKSYRKLGAADWVLLGAAIASFAVPMASGIIDVMSDSTGHSRRTATDGRFVYTIPEGYNCLDTIIDGARVIYLTEPVTENSILMCRGEDSDATKANFERYFNNWLPDHFHGRDYTVAEDEKITTNECTVFYRKIQAKYMMDWEFALAFHRASGRVSIINAFTDPDEYSPVHTIISDLEFH